MHLGRHYVVAHVHWRSLPNNCYGPSSYNYGITEFHAFTLELFVCDWCPLVTYAYINIKVIVNEFSRCLQWYIVIIIIALYLRFWQVWIITAEAAIKDNTLLCRLLLLTVKLPYMKRKSSHTFESESSPLMSITAFFFVYNAHYKHYSYQAPYSYTWKVLPGKSNFTNFATCYHWWKFCPQLMIA